MLSAEPADPKIRPSRGQAAANPEQATFTGPTGTFRQRAELTKPQRDILAKLDIPTPKEIAEAVPAADA
ncbi:hypothetical protein ACIBI7_38175 [Nonomuraea fuscirosea]|uniref:hypothetical protein n=1 Tax=Nonomuraea fuscirosea TaxID=1291556 RepID=UPI00378EBB14